jgi:hypothetical protein
MTERLSTLLRSEADAVAVPAVDVREIVRQGRGRRRRRHDAEALVAVGVGGVLVGGAVALRPAGSGGLPEVSESFAASSPATAYEDYGAFSIGSTVFVGNHRVQFDQKIKALYYTSEGVLVRMGDVAETDAGGPSRYVLVAPDGSTRGIPLEMGDRVPGTDAESPYVAYAEPLDGHHGSRWELVAVDLRTGKEAHRTRVEDRPFTWGGWEAPPVTTHGDRMWALVDDGWLEYDWSTGTTRLLPGTKGARLEAGGGRFANPAEPNWDPDSTAKGRFTVRDLATSAVLRDLTLEPGELAWLAPDGRHVRIDDGPTTYGDDDRLIDPPGPSRFVSVDTGRTAPIPGDRLLGWTPTGDALAVDTAKDLLSVCDTDAGTCTDVHVDLPDGKVKLGGLLYES